jgi:nicotinamidase/pyrazinamidase
MRNYPRDGDALLIVDVQIDFFPGGRLPVPRGDEIIPVINQLIHTANPHHVPIFASRDWHPANHCSFKEQGGSWPLHCVQHTKGANFHPDIHWPPSTQIINKGETSEEDVYSAFRGKMPNGTSLDSALKQQGIRRLWISGLAQEVCVCESALEGRAYGYEVHLILSGTRPITERAGEDSLARMKSAGVIIEI